MAFVQLRVRWWQALFSAYMWCTAWRCELLWLWALIESSLCVSMNTNRWFALFIHFFTFVFTYVWSVFLGRQVADSRALREDIMIFLVSLISWAAGSCSPLIGSLKTPLTKGNALLIPIHFAYTLTLIRDEIALPTALATMQLTSEPNDDPSKGIKIRHTSLAELDHGSQTHQTLNFIEIKTLCIGNSSCMCHGRDHTLNK